jgi:hypothetical protein
MFKSQVERFKGQVERYKEQGRKILCDRLKDSRAR